MNLINIETDEANVTYESDIEMVMDFMKLSLLFDNASNTIDNLITITKLQKSILEILPVAQSNRMSSIYDLLAEIYRRNKREVEDKSRSTEGYPKGYSKGLSLDRNNFLSDNLSNKRKDHFIILFYKSSCPQCIKINPIWNEFKMQNDLSNFTTIEYDWDDTSNSEIFRLFKIKKVPTIVKLRLDNNAGNYAEELVETVNLDNLSRFTNF